MSVDLYKTLGVSRTAGIDAIKRAHRKKAMAAHPDRGGDPEEFAQVDLAWKVLSDPARRAKYDATGQTDNPNVEDLKAKAIMTAFGQTFQAVMQELMEKGVMPGQINLVDSMRQAIANTKGNLAKEIEKAKKARSLMADVLDNRISVTDGENHLVAIAQSTLKAIDGQRALMESQQAALDGALELLKKFKFRQNVQVTTAWAITGATSMGGTW